MDGRMGGGWVVDGGWVYRERERERESESESERERERERERENTVNEKHVRLGFHNILGGNRTRLVFFTLEPVPVWAQSGGSGSGSAVT